jgi:hypothetical protein
MVEGMKKSVMKTLRLVALVGPALLLVPLVWATPQISTGVAQGHAAHFQACAKVCADCSRQCDSCHHHCVHLVANGNKDHVKSMELCVDCGEACRLAAALSGRESRLAGHACECCAKCCDECAEACESFKDDTHMADCAKACRDCAKVCREMVKMVKV